MDYTSQYIVCQIFKEAILMLNDRLRSTRIARELILQQVADELHISLRNYQKYESGDSAPTLEGLVKIADMFNVPTDYLLGRDKYLESIGVTVDVSPENPPRRPNPHKK
jgi:transcriptional regulator with XRE-family HTH domain